MALVGVRRSLLSKRVGASADAPQTTAFLARTTGLSGTETAAYKGLINGLVSDGTFALLDCLYIFATNSTTTANLNLIQNNFNITVSVAPTFTADQGYTGNGSTQFLNTNFNPSTAGGQMVQNSASIGAYVLTNRASNASVEMGAANAVSTFTYLSVFQSSLFAAEANGGTFSAGVSAGGASQGFSTVSRTVAGSIDQYKNASSTSLGTTTDASTGQPPANFYICGYNNNGTLTSPTADQISAAFIGGGITGAQHLALSNRINAYMTALGINVY